MPPDDYLTPDELHDDRLTPLGDGRYVVRLDDRNTTDRPTPEAAHDDSPQAGGTTPGLDTLPASYALAVAFKTDAGVTDTLLTGDDVQALTVDLLRWYAARIAPTHSPADALDVLLAGTEFAR
jgi:hypothetical protein